LNNVLFVTIILFWLAHNLEAREPASRSQKIKLLENLMQNNLIYVSQEIIRNDLKKGVWIGNYERYLDTIISDIGTEQLDRINLTGQQLKNSKNLNYISAKNDLRKNLFRLAAKKLKRSLKPDKSFYPNQLLHLASAQQLNREYKKALNNLLDCEGMLKGQVGRESGIFGQEKKIILDTCIMNQARLEFEQGNFLLANRQYEKIEKSSLIWPEILFEQAWTSFYQGNYNRTLGKLVTYRSPFFDFIFNPEVEVLEALSYMEICFYQNTQKVVNDFYQKYSNDAKYLKRFLKKYSNNPSKVGSLLINLDNKNAIKNKLLKRLLNSISKDLVYRRLIQNYYGIKDELSLIKQYPERRYVSYLAKRIMFAEKRQRRLIGTYAIRILDRANRQLIKSFQGMSYIRLEILKKEKQKFFGNEYKVGKIGELRNVTFDSSHYVWSFNGEFWADELGDYVYSLKSECHL